MGFLFLDSDLSQNLENCAGFDFQLPGQLVDPNFLCLISQDRSLLDAYPIVTITLVSAFHLLLGGFGFDL